MLFSDTPIKSYFFATAVKSNQDFFIILEFQCSGRPEAERNFALRSKFSKQKGGGRIFQSIIRIMFVKKKIWFGFFCFSFVLQFYVLDFAYSVFCVSYFVFYTSLNPNLCFNFAQFLGHCIRQIGFICK